MRNPRGWVRQINRGTTLRTLFGGQRHVKEPTLLAQLCDADRQALWRDQPGPSYRADVPLYTQDQQ